jgi:hypothetical protein
VARRVKQRWWGQELAGLGSVTYCSGSVRPLSALLDHLYSPHTVQTMLMVVVFSTSAVLPMATRAARTRLLAAGRAPSDEPATDEPQSDKPAMDEPRWDDPANRKKNAPDHPEEARCEEGGSEKSTSTAKKPAAERLPRTKETASTSSDAARRAVRRDEGRVVAGRRWLGHAAAVPPATRRPCASAPAPRRCSRAAPS